MYFLAVNTYACSLCQKIYNRSDLPTDPTALAEFKCTNCRGSVLPRVIQDSAVITPVVHNSYVAPQQNTTSSGGEIFLGILVLGVFIVAAVFVLSWLFGLDWSGVEVPKRMPFRVPRRR